MPRSRHLRPGAASADEFIGKSARTLRRGVTLSTPALAGTRKSPTTRGQEVTSIYNVNIVQRQHAFSACIFKRHRNNVRRPWSCLRCAPHRDRTREYCKNIPDSERARGSGCARRGCELSSAALLNAALPARCDATCMLIEPLLVSTSLATWVEAIEARVSMLAQET